MANEKDITRREFVGLSAKAAVGGVALLHAAPAALKFSAKQRQRPNVLVIMSDEHNASVAGCYGNKLVHTPHLDELAANGVTFDNCYCNSPLCVPSRNSFTAGKYASRVSAWNNNSWLPSAEIPSLPRILDAAGYEAFLGGKMHYDKTRRYGFTELYPSNLAFKTGKGRRRAAEDKSVNLKMWENRAAEFHVGDNSGTINHDTKVTKHCSEFLAKRKRGDKPFFLLAGYLAPHFPLTVPEDCYAPYRDRVAMPSIPSGYLDSLPLNYKHLRRGFGFMNPDPAVTKRGRELYFGLTQWCDTEIGKLLGTLKKSPFADNTVVIYVSDHGENMGEHGLWWKNAMFETAARVPLIISWPERWGGGQQRTGACSLVDVVQTIADIGGANVPGDWNGTSLTGWLDDKRAHWKDLAISEYYAHNIASGYTMVRTGQFKYVYHNRMDAQHGPEREFYDLSADPAELKNLASDAKYGAQIEQMHKAILRETGCDPDETEQRCRAEMARGYGREHGNQRNEQADE